MIEESKSEGIFVVEGEPELQINSNWINKNTDGIVLLNSNGKIYENKLNQNLNVGIQTIGQTTARLTENKIVGCNFTEATKIGGTTWKTLRDAH